MTGLEITVDNVRTSYLKQCKQLHNNGVYKPEFVEVKTAHDKLLQVALDRKCPKCEGVGYYYKTVGFYQSKHVCNGCKGSGKAENP